MEYSLVVSRVTVRPAHGQPLIDWQEVSSLSRFIFVLITFGSHHRLLTRGHDLAVLSIMPSSILETHHLTVNHASAVRHTAPSSLHPHYRQVMQTLIVVIDQSFTVLHTLHASVSGKSLFSTFVYSSLSVYQALQANRLIHTSCMVRNVLFIAKCTIVGYKRLMFIVEYVILGPDNRSGEE